MSGMVTVVTAADREDHLVSLRAFARLVGMPEATARRWAEAGRIKGERNAVGRWRIPVGQLADVRQAWMPGAEEAT